MIRVTLSTGNEPVRTLSPFEWTKELKGMIGSFTMEKYYDAKGRGWEESIYRITPDKGLGTYTVTLVHRRH